MRSFDVAIVGYGPVGQTLAILLAERGWSVCVLEKQPAAYPLPRAVHFDHEVARIFQAAGIAEHFADTAEIADAYEWRNANGQTLLSFASEGLGLSGWPEGNMFAQPDLERILDARVCSLSSIELHRGCEVTDIDVAEATVRVRTRDAEPREIAARYVVGCDGANSFIRERLGASVTDLGFFFDWLIVDVRPHHPTTWRPLNIQICDPERPTTLVSGGPGRRRWEFMRLPGESIEHLNSAATAWRLLERWGVTPQNAELERHTVYRFQARWVDRWRSGPLLIAGDAAHQMPPFAGQGMCSGIRDAANLTWKLDLVLAGKAGDALLDTYASERVPHVAALIDFSMQLGKVICIADPAEAQARDAMMIAAAAEGQALSAPLALGLGPGVRREGDSHGGTLSVQGRVRHAGKTGLFDDVVGRGWTLLSSGGDPASVLDAEAAAFFASLGGITAGVSERGAVHDLEGTYARWFERAGMSVALQRPDFYLFGAADALAGANELVRALRSALSA